MTQIELMKDPSYTNPEFAEIVRKSGPGDKLAPTTDIPVLRKALLDMKDIITAANKSTEQRTTQETDHEIGTRDGAKIVVRVYQGPKSGGGPALVWLHGGGFCLGGLDNEETLCRQFCEIYQGVAFNVEYRLAPEHPFPTPVHDCYAALKWVAANTGQFGADPSKGFILGGISAGGNIAAAISHVYRDEEVQPPLTGIFLSIPSIIDSKAVPDKYRKEHTSVTDNKNAPLLDAGAMECFRVNYAGEPKSPLKSPLLFETGHAGLPPTYLQVCGLDPLRDDGLIYERVLREDCGIKTKIDLYPGLPHAFWVWWPKANFSVQQQKDSIDGLGWLLQAGK